MRRTTVLLVIVLLTAGCDTSGRSGNEGAGRDIGRSRPAAVPTKGPGGVGLSWSRGADLPTPRTEVAVVAFDQKVYVAGGFTEDGRASRVVEVYDPKSDSWVGGLDLPRPIHHAGITATDNDIWLVGGYRQDGSATDEVWSWRPGQVRWTPRPPLPTARGALAVASAYGEVYAIGGSTSFRDGKVTGANEVLLPGESSWQRLEPLPEPREHLAAIGTEMASSFSHGGGGSFDSTIDVVGGRKLSLDSNTARWDRYAYERPMRESPTSRGRDPKSGQWIAMDQLGTELHPRAGFALATASPENTWLFAFGGEEPSGTIDRVDYQGPHKCVAWCEGPDLPTPRHGLGAAAIGARIYVVGGGATPGLSVSAANEILTLRD